MLGHDGTHKIALRSLVELAKPHEIKVAMREQTNFHDIVSFTING